MSGTFSDNYYMRRCVMCGWVMRRNEWDETPPMEFCPTCGIPMERMECRSCGSPLAVMEQSGFLVWGPSTKSAAPFCGFCGEPTAPPRERQYRTKPLETKSDPAPDLWLRTHARRIVRGE